MNIGVNRLLMLTEEFDNRKVIKKEKIKDIDFIYCDYMEHSGILEVNEQWTKLDENTLIEGNDKHFWIHFCLDLKELNADEEYRLRVSTGHTSGWDAMNPQMLVYMDHMPLCGMDKNHQEIFLPFSGCHEVHIYAHTGMAVDKFPLTISVLKIDTNAEQLYYDLKTALDTCNILGEESEETNKIVTVIKKAAMLLDLRNISAESYKESVIKAREYLTQNLYNGKGTIGEKPITCIGHTHIDVAWLWTLQQTREKVQRSFSTVLMLMEKYPEYHFMSSQPVLYKYFKETQPHLYQKIKEKVDAKVWEPEGAMWLESDCNNTSGESLIRQIMYGKRFFREEFGVDNKIVWLPDVFGFNAALPQVLKKCGIDYFVTSKLSWNETNKMPFDTFYWKGIDGSKVFANFITSRMVPAYNESDTHTDYNGKITPSYALGTFKRYQHKEFNDELFIPFGWGDGGGGATKEMLETQRRLNKGIVGLPKTQIGRITDYLKRVKDNFDENCEKLKKIPEWYGELYFELHRGTYTSMAKNKQYNRKCELMQQKLEGIYSILNNLMGVTYPQEDISSMWEIILLNQFHDILPGSAVEKVYAESANQYEEILSKMKSLLKNAMRTIAENVHSSSEGVLVYNPNSFSCSDYMRLEDKYVYAQDVPAMGWKIVSPECEKREFATWSDEYSLETPYYIVRFDSGWNIVSLYDKDAGRELVQEGGKCNQFEIYENYPYCFDAWEISEYYADKVWYVDDVLDVKKIVENGVIGVEITRKYNKSVIVQKILFYEKIRRIDFDTEVDWHEDKILLKVAFPWNIYANEATYDIPFGNFVRPTHSNTSWDQARFEVNGHKWVDLSEDDYGVSLLNDCKYGYNVKESVVRMSLLTSPLYPNPKADRGINKFKYSIYPHKNTVNNSDTVQQSYILNQRMESIQMGAQNGKLTENYSLVQCSSPSVIIETLKQSEDGTGYVLRMYQSAKKREEVHFSVQMDVKKVFSCLMTEEIEKDILVEGNSFTLNLAPFEVVTLLLRCKD